MDEAKLAAAIATISELIRSGKPPNEDAECEVLAETVYVLVRGATSPLVAGAALLTTLLRITRAHSVDGENAHTTLINALQKMCDADPTTLTGLVHGFPSEAKLDRESMTHNEAVTALRLALAHAYLDPSSTLLTAIVVLSIDRFDAMPDYRDTDCKCGHGFRVHAGRESGTRNGGCMVPGCACFNIGFDAITHTRR